MSGFEVRDVPTDPVAATSPGQRRTDRVRGVDEDVVERALAVLAEESRDWTAERHRMIRHRHDDHPAPGTES